MTSFCSYDKFIFSAVTGQSILKQKKRGEHFLITTRRFAGDRFLDGFKFVGIKEKRAAE
jgi:hypothetical protein